MLDLATFVVDSFCRTFWPNQSGWNHMALPATYAANIFIIGAGHDSGERVEDRPRLGCPPRTGLRAICTVDEQVLP